MSRNYASSSSATATSSDSVQASSLHDEAKDVKEELKVFLINNMSSEILKIWFQENFSSDFIVI